jgi:4-hydroxy-tetrahydrodipicolinate reductase
MGKANVEVFSGNRSIVLAGAIEDENCPLIGQDAGTVAGVGPLDVTLTANLEQVIEESDVVVEFTNRAATMKHAKLSHEHKKAMVIGTTGISDIERETIRSYAQTVPIVLSPNMSLGINTLFHLVALAAKMLGEDFDTEIFEIHHNRKKDAPSGTALQFGKVIAEARKKELHDLAVCGREGLVGERRRGEIGIMALRMSDVVGDHTIIFGGTGERIEFTHRSFSRKNYATGALRAVRYVAERDYGFFTMADVLGLK